MEGKLDLAVVVMPMIKFKGEVKPLRRDEILLVANREHPAVQYAHPLEDMGRAWISLEDAAKFELILSGFDTILGSVAREILMKKRLKYHADNDNISAAMAVSMAKEGLGLAFTYQVLPGAGFGDSVHADRRKGRVCGSGNCLPLGGVPFKGGRRSWRRSFGRYTRRGERQEMISEKPIDNTGFPYLNLITQGYILRAGKPNGTYSHKQSVREDTKW